MNGKKRSDQDLLHLGLPPMELSESSPKVTETISNHQRKCTYSFLGKALIVLIILLMAIGSYVTLLSTINNLDTHKTEVIIFADIKGNLNTTSQNLKEIVVQALNKTSHLKKRKKRASNNVDNRSSNEKQITEARDIIKNYDDECNEENVNEVCKGLVLKLKSTGVDQQLFLQPSEVVKIEESNKEINKIKTVDFITSTEKSKRETSSVIQEKFRSLPGIQIERRDIHSPNHNEPGSAYGNIPQIPPPLSETCLLARLLNPPSPLGPYHPQPSEYLQPPNIPLSLPSLGYKPLLPYQSRDADARKQAVHPQDTDIFMKFLNETRSAPLKQVCNGTFQDEKCFRDADCSEGTVPCDNGECIALDQWCDGNVECSDVSDESRCDCKSRVDKSRLCDGYFDCPYGEDEMGCYGCSDIAFSCGDIDVESRSTCFIKEQRCNNIIDCPNHKDEIECSILAPTLHKKPLFPISNTEGFLHRNYKGDWYPVCLNPYMWAHETCRRETGLILRPPYIQLLPIDPMTRVNYLNTGPGGSMDVSNICFNSSAVYVTCPDLLCGTRVITSAQSLRENTAIENNLFGRNKRFLINAPQSLLFYRNRFRRHTANENIIPNEERSNEDKRIVKRAESRVVGGRPSKPAAWPWLIAMYRDGMFHCGGVIITQSWIVSAAHCVYRFWEHYYEIQAGMLRRFSYSPQEQNHVVTHVIVNHHYSQTDMKNDVSLLKVKPAIIFSRWVRPICLPGPDTAGPDWMWGPPRNTMCTAVGWGATAEHGPDPDHMREVEVPIWDHCKHKEDQAGKEICAGLVQGGRDACQGDSGGPLLCRNPLNPQQWYMAGIVSHGDGCARKDEPGVYTRVSLFVKWIKHNIYSATLPTIQPKHACPGFTCVSGISKCIPKKRVCDKIVDCLNGEDERDCNPMGSTQRIENLFLPSPLNLFNKFVPENDGENIEPKVTTQDFTVKKNIDGSNTQRSTTQNPNTETATQSEQVLVTTTPASQNTYTETEFNGNDFITTESTKPRQAEVLLPAIQENAGPLAAFSSHLARPTTESSSTTIHLPEARDSITEDISLSDTDKSATSDENIDFSNASPFEISSTDSFEQRNNNEEKRSTDDDANTFAIDFSKESFGSRSMVADNEKNKNSDIQDDLKDFQNEHSLSTTVLNNIETTTHSETTTENQQGTQEPKALSIDLLQDTTKSHIQSTEDIVSSTNTNTNDRTESVNNIRAKKEQLNSILPAKIRKKHRVPLQFECKRIFQIISYKHRCNHQPDCEDGTDELGCTCIDYLLTFDRKLICDGTYDCADGQDEIDCFSCPEGHFLCKKSQVCISPKNICDGKLHCPDGEDELDCFTLSNGRNIIHDIDGRPTTNLEGYLTKKHANDWHIVCEDNITREEQDETATQICRYLGFSSFNKYQVKYINVKEDQIIKSGEDIKRNRRETNEVPVHFAYKNHNKSVTSRHIIIKEPQILKEECVPNVTKTCMSLYVYCDRSLFYDLDASQQLFLSRESENFNHTWPWATKIYSEGQYKCTGILIDNSWVLVRHSCLFDSLLSHHVTVSVGSHRSLSLTTGMYEQIYTVDTKRDLYHSDITLLHLSKPANYSSMVKPMAIPSQNMINAKPSICVALGQNSKNTTVGMFLQEITENCHYDSRCFKVIDSDMEICNSKVTMPQRKWFGIVTCYADNGWYPAASFVENKGECKFGNRIIAQEIGDLRSEMRNLGDINVMPLSDAGNASDNCEGYRCGRGQCAALSHVCDGVRHCHDGLDESEEACEKKYSICTENPYAKGCDCTAGQFKCRNGMCVPKETYRDGKDDCGDDYDEPEYNTCSHYLARVHPSRLCDGILHCKDRSDEDPMFCKCFAKDGFKCRGSDHCVAYDMVCDGTKDCPGGEDERVCIGLNGPSLGTGQVIVSSHGVWHSKCYPNKNHTKSDLENICKELGFLSGHAKQLDPPAHFKVFNYNSVSLEPFSEVILNNRTKIQLRSTDEPIAKAMFNDTLQDCHPIYIECL